MLGEPERPLTNLKQGDHLCPICETVAEGITVILPFLKEGLACGERCLCIAGEATLVEVGRSLAAEGVDVAGECARGHLELRNEPDTYASDGEGDPRDVMEFWRRAEAEALATGHSGLRVVGEAISVLGAEAGRERFMEYEALLNEFLPGSRTVILCLYDRSRFEPAVIHDMLRTHPVVVLRDQVCPNPYYEPPELLQPEFRAGAAFTAKRVDWWIAQLKRARSADQERVQMLEQVELDRARLEAIFRQMPAGVAIFEAPSGRFLSGNAQLEHIWRRPVPPMDNLQDQGLYQGFHPDGRPYATEEWPAARALLSGEEIVEEEIDILRGDGSRGTVRASASPIRDRGGRIIAGVLTVYDITERKRVEWQLREHTATLAALSRRLVEVQEVERRRLARELHDEIGQLLTSLKFAVAAARMPEPPEMAQAKIAEAGALADEALTRVRSLSFDLRPAMLDHLGLAPALRSLIERYSASTGIRVDLQHAGIEGRLAPEVETSGYRIVQEALTNVARHAGVSEAAVRLWADASALMVQVEDQGAGFDVEAALAAGRTNGLPGMQERLMLLGGRLEIESAPGSGTHLLAELPLTARSEEDTP